ncbi:hypothetical protein ACW5WN_17145 [Aeromonas lacus]|uniref:hypothetical protein n=1 Tax=Aeromonas lacus TaxID=558884 RepID=UPI00126A7AB1|nr:hypothetical protein [Aeromonas lacus]
MHDKQDTKANTRQGLKATLRTDIKPLRKRLPHFKSADNSFKKILFIIPRQIFEDVHYQDRTLWNGNPLALFAKSIQL